MINFLTPEEEARVIDAIQDAEQGTSGEIRVHIDNHERVDPLEEAAHVFERLGMHKTEFRNGVLLFISPKCRAFSIIGDKGISDRVEPDFWESELGLLRSFFQEERYADGICEVLGHVGNKLKTLFPDEFKRSNELPDDISYS